MDGTIDDLLRLEGAKHQALIDGDAPSYDEHVRTQLHLLDACPDIRAAARYSTEKLDALSRLMRLNTALLLNLIATSPVFSNGNSYSAKGAPEAVLSRRFSVEG